MWEGKTLQTLETGTGDNVPIPGAESGPGSAGTSLCELGSGEPGSRQRGRAPANDGIGEGGTCSYEPVSGLSILSSDSHTRTHTHSAKPKDKPLSMTPSAADVQSSSKSKSNSMTKTIKSTTKWVF